GDAVDDGDGRGCRRGVTGLCRARRQGRDRRVDDDRTTRDGTLARRGAGSGLGRGSREGGGLLRGGGSREGFGSDGRRLVRVAVRDLGEALGGGFGRGGGGGRGGGSIGGFGRGIEDRIGVRGVRRIGCEVVRRGAGVRPDRLVLHARDGGGRGSRGFGSIPGIGRSLGRLRSVGYGGVRS